jgi:hypothetical protein
MSNKIRKKEERETKKNEEQVEEYKKKGGDVGPDQVTLVTPIRAKRVSLSLYVCREKEREAFHSMEHRVV